MPTDNVSKIRTRTGESGDFAPARQSPAGEQRDQGRYGTGRAKGL